MKLCMKFLRDNCHSDVLEKLMDSTGTSLEDESLTLLHRELVSHTIELSYVCVNYKPSCSTDYVVNVCQK